MAEKLISTACTRGAHKSCRGRVLLTGDHIKSSRDRWAACDCPCPHDRGDGCLEYARREAASLVVDP